MHYNGTYFTKEYPMELLTLLLLILVILILIKLGSIQDELEKIQKLLKEKEYIETIKPMAQPIIQKKSTEDISLIKSIETIKKIPPKIEKPKHPNIIIERLKKQFGDISLEELLFGNIILKIAIVAFILGIGLFLKYSIDKDWIPIWGRVLIGIVVGISMLGAGIRMIDNRHKLFSEGLFGGGIAVLYLSVFASFALEGFKFVDVHYAFVAMIAITLLAGIISIRFDAKSTAIFGLIGGFATPFLLSTDSGNYVGLLSYMLMLNLGVLYISVYKKWSLLSWLAFGITSLTALATVWNTENDFVALALLYASFFIIYSIVPFINEILGKEERLEKPFVFLFWANFLVAIVSFLSLFEQYEIALLYYALVTVLLAGYLLGYASLLAHKNVLLKNLFYIVLAQSIALLLVTPAFIFDGSSLTIVWAVESLMLLWISIKSNEKTYGLFAFFGFAVTVFRYMLFDVMTQYELLVYSSNHANIMLYVQHLALTSLFVIGSLFIGYRLLKNSALDFVYVSVDFIKMALFMLTFFGAYLVLTFMGSLLTELYLGNLFLIFSMLLIALFAFLLYNSAYKETAKVIFSLFMGLMILSFIANIIHIGMQNTLISLLNFLVFMGVAGFIYILAFKDSNLMLAHYKLSNILLALGVVLLFIFLNVELYYLVKLYTPTATKFAMTLLWVLFGIGLFVYGVFKEIKLSKVVGTVLIFIAILKAFLVDLANLDSIYRIVLFLILGTILFGLSYFYQSKQEKKS